MEKKMETTRMGHIGYILWFYSMNRSLVLLG